MIIVILAVAVIAIIILVNISKSSSGHSSAHNVSKPREGYTIVNPHEFFHKYVKGGIIDAELCDHILDLIEKGVTSAEVPTATIAEYERLLYKHVQEENKMYECVDLNNTGIALEKEGKIDEAIEIYERCLDKAPVMCHPYDRLMILYRKRKDYDNEIKVIDLALQILGARWPNLIEKYSTRKEKALLLKQKSTN
jgi:tetratricopeptide (TPR) repeat protein